MAVGIKDEGAKFVVAQFVSVQLSIAVVNKLAV